MLVSDCSDLLDAEKIMGFLVFFFPSCLVAEKIPCLVAEKINIRQTFFFYWATEWALKYHGPTGPVEPAGPGKKIRLVNGPSLGCGSWFMGRVRIWKYPARTQPVVIPRNYVRVVCERVKGKLKLCAFKRVS